jgi:hypothetical protein
MGGQIVEQIRILSDYTSTSEPNILHIVYDDQGDVHISLFKSKGNDESGVRIAASGSRHTSRVSKAFWELINAYKEELADEDCNKDLIDSN